MASAVAPMNSSATWGGSGNSTSTAASSSSASSSTISSLTSPFLFGSHHYQLRLWPRQRQQHASTKRDDNNNNNKRGRRRMRGNSNGNRTRPTSSNASFVVASSMVDILAGWIAYEGNIDQHHLHHLFLGVGVGLPCTVMPCGDIIYRSTLPQPTGLSLTAPGVGLALAAVSYLWATPGVAPGFWDMFVLSFLERAFRPSYGKDDFVLGRKLGEGAFGVVYRASLSKTCKYSNIKVFLMWT